MNIIERIYQNTDDFVKQMPKETRKKYGQFFTTPQTASFMSSLINVDMNRPSLSILDAGAGTGILGTAAIQYLREQGYHGAIHLTCYETDINVLPILKDGLELLKETFGISYSIIQENYILSQKFKSGSSENLYDIIIGNPPYKKISKDAPEALAIPEVCYGAPNLYFLFWAMAICNLKQGCEMIYIIPRSWTSGAYFAKFREFLFEECAITHLHLFESRNKVFDGESVLQETMIIKVRKGKQHDGFISVTSSSTSDFSDKKEFQAPYDVVVSSRKYVFLVTDESEVNTLKQLSKMEGTLLEIKHPMKTGIVVDFRTREVLRNEPDENTFPLLYAQHIKNGRVKWPVGKEDEYICTERKGFLQENTNYLLVKRFTAKEEKRRLQCGVYLSSEHPEYDFISTQNKVNFIKCETPELAFGLYVLMNSTVYDNYYRILNGSTQVNSTEINTMPVPDCETIEAMGKQIMGKELTEFNCNKIIEKWII